MKRIDFNTVSDIASLVHIGET